MKTPPPFVSLVAPGRWLLKGADHLRAGLAELPVTIGLTGTQITLNFPANADERFAAALASSLRDLGFAFSYGQDWSPSAYLQHLRDHQALSGTFTEISWTAPGE